MSAHLTDQLLLERPASACRLGLPTEGGAIRHFGAGWEPGFLECWDRGVSTVVFSRILRTLRGEFCGETFDVGVRETGWSAVFRGLVREVG